MQLIIYATSGIHGQYWTVDRFPFGDTEKNQRCASKLIIHCPPPKKKKKKKTPPPPPRTLN